MINSEYVKNNRKPRKKYGEISMIKWNSKLCQNINLVNMNLFYFGRAQVDKKWSGKVQNPVYSRLFYIVDGTGCIKWGHGQELNFGADSWYLLPAGCSFEYSCPEYLDHVYFNFKHKN